MVHIDAILNSANPDALYAVEELYDKATILGARIGKTAQQVVIDFSIFNGYSLDSRERCLEYLNRKPDGKWLYMTDKKIGEEIDRLDRPSDDEFRDYAPWIFEGSPPLDLAATLQASIDWNEKNKS